MQIARVLLACILLASVTACGGLADPIGARDAMRRCAKTPETERALPAWMGMIPVLACR